MMDTSKPSDETIQKLKSAGWYENRRVEMGALSALYTQAGLILPQNVFDFMSEFSGIEVKTRSGFSLVGFIVEPTLKHCTKRDFDEMGDVLRLPVFPIGHTEHGTQTLLMDEAGHMFSYSDTLYFIGENPWCGIENLCDAREFEAVPYEYATDKWQQWFDSAP